MIGAFSFATQYMDEAVLVCVPGGGGATSMYLIDIVQNWWLSYRTWVLSYDVSLCQIRIAIRHCHKQTASMPLKTSMFQIYFCFIKLSIQQIVTNPMNFGQFWTSVFGDNPNKVVNIQTLMCIHTHKHAYLWSAYYTHILYSIVFSRSDALDPNDANIVLSVAGRSWRTKSGGKVAISWPSFDSGSNKPTKMGFAGTSTYQALYGILTVTSKNYISQFSYDTLCNILK